MSTEGRMWHIAVGGDPEAAVRYGLTLKAKCGLVWAPKYYATKDERPSIPDCPDCHADLPHRFPEVPHFVYRCFDDTGRLIYVGCTRTPKQRMEQHRANSWWFEQHRANSWWFDQAVDTRYLVFPNRLYALEMERQAIASENPRWNVRHRDRSQWTADDYRDAHYAMSLNDAAESRLNKLRREAKRRWDLDLEAEAS